MNTIAIIQAWNHVPTCIATYMPQDIDEQSIQEFTVSIIIGMSLSEPHTSVVTGDFSLYIGMLVVVVVVGIYMSFCKFCGPT